MSSSFFSFTNLVKAITDLTGDSYKVVTKIWHSKIMKTPSLRFTKKPGIQFGHKAIKKSMRPVSIQHLLPLWDQSCRKTGHRYWQKIMKLDLNLHKIPNSTHLLSVHNIYVILKARQTASAFNKKVGFFTNLYLCYMTRCWNQKQLYCFQTTILLEKSYFSKNI